MHRASLFGTTAAASHMYSRKQAFKWGMYTLVDRGVINVAACLAVLHRHALAQAVILRLE